MKKKRYLVTGGTGFIGSALVRRLAGEGHRVRVLDNDLRGASRRLKGLEGRVEMVRADIRDHGKVLDACRGVDCACHLAYINGTEYFYKRPDLVLDIGVKGMVNMVDSCIRRKVKEFVLLSSSEVYQTPPTVPTDERAPLSIPDPLNPRYSYAGGKVISELMAINYGRRYFDRVIIVRPHNVYGPDMGMEHVIPQFIFRMKEACRVQAGRPVKFLIHGTGRETRAFIFIDDFIDALMKVVEKGRHLGIYNIGTTEEIPIAKVAAEAGAYFGRRVRIVGGKAPQGSPLRRCPDIKKIMALGFKPRVSFTEGFSRTARWYDGNSGSAGPKAARRKIDSEDIRSR